MTGLRHHEPEPLPGYLALRCELAALRFQLALIRGFRTLEALEAKANFNPSEPRVPAGSTDGGQWTTGGGGGGGGRSQAGGRLQVAQNEEDTPRRPLLGEFIDPTAEIRIQQFGEALRNIRELEPNNPQLTYATGPNYVPSWNAVNRAQAELEAARTRARTARTARLIANGHALREHAMKDFGVSTSDELYGIVLSALNDPTSQTAKLRGGQSLFYQRSTNTLVLVDPRRADRGTAYRPEKNQAYVDYLIENR